MQQIKINFADFWKSFDREDNYFTDILRKKYTVVIDKEPDYLFCGTFGNSHLKYDCVKIFFTGENIYPDFNLYDYAVGFHNISFDDRYLRLPLYVLYPEACRLALRKHTYNDDRYLNKKGFCSYCISNSLADPARDQIVRLLESYQDVASGGRYRNNVGGPVPDKLAFTRDYRFSVVFENSSARGYTTEKIVEAFAAETIPIYWGNPDIEQEFNGGSFINCHRYKSFEDVLRTVREIDGNPDRYLAMLKTSAVQEDSLFHKFLDEDRTLRFLERIFEQPPESAFRRNRIYVGARYEQRMKFYRKVDAVLAPFRKTAYYLHNRARSFLTRRSSR